MDPSNILLISLLLISILSVNLVSGKTDNNSNDQGKDGYYDQETPKDWVDVLFILIMCLFHLEYVFKFTDYSLSHVHLATVDMNKTDAEILKMEEIQSFEIDAMAKSPSTSNTPAAIRNIFAMGRDVASLFTTKFDKKYNNIHYGRKMHNRVCCVIKCAPHFFTWERTYLLRLFLKLWCTASCLLALVLYAEFFMNLFVEFIITCVVHYKSGYPAALIVLPIIAFVVDVLLRLGWHSVVISWSLNCDANGDLEENNYAYLTSGLRKKIRNEHKMQFAYTRDFMKSDDSDSSGSDEADCCCVIDLSICAFPKSNNAHETVELQQTTSVPIVASPKKAQDMDTNDGNSQDGKEEEEVIDDHNEKAEQAALVDWKEQHTQSHSDTSTRASEQERFASETLGHLPQDTQDQIRADILETDGKSDDNEAYDNGGNEAEVKSNDEVNGYDIDAIDIDSGDFAESPTEKDTKSRKGRVSTLTDMPIEAHTNDDEAKYDNDNGDLEMNNEEHSDSDAGVLSEKVLEAKDEEDEKQMKARKQYEKESYNRLMGDYWMASCWRLGFFWYVVIFAVIASASLDLETYTNGIFIQLLMRYCVIGATCWVWIYSLSAFFISVGTRWKTWNDIHPKINRWKMFLLIDAHDLDKAVNNGKDKNEKSHYRWTKVKMTIMASSIGAFVVCVLASYIGNSKDWSSFVHFIGILFLFYYSINLFMSCKPYALLALWTDSIPPPGKNFRAHGDVLLAMHENKELPADFDLNILRNMQTCSKSKGIFGKTGRAIADHDDGDGDEDVEVTVRSKLQALDSNANMLMQRYNMFKYKYVECDMDADKYSGRSIIANCDWTYVLDKSEAMRDNYEAYWLNVYRPFDEFDVEGSLRQSHILYGFQWLKKICTCTLCRKSGKASRSGKRTRKCRDTKRAFGKVCKYLMDNCCNICAFVTVCVCLILMFVASEKLSGNQDAWNENVIYEKDQETYYGVCSDLFSSSDSNYDLTVLDVTFLAQAVYEADNYDLCEMINVYFNGEFELVAISRTEPFFFHIRHKTYDIDVIALRGTDTVLEMLQDISLFVEVGIFECLQWIVPFLNGLSVSLMRQIIYYSSYMEGLINADVRSGFDEPVILYARNYLFQLENECENETNSTTSMYFVGHSLGGAIAEIVAANLYEDENINSNVQSFGVCSPGVLLSSAKFGFGVQSLDKTSSSILPRRDIVSKVDEHGGSVQYTECDANYAMTCHLTDNLFCELFYGCPSDLPDKYSNISSKYEYSNSSRLQWFVEFCNNSESNDIKAQMGDVMNIEEITKNSTKYCDKKARSNCKDQKKTCDAAKWDTDSDYNLCSKDI